MTQHKLAEQLKVGRGRIAWAVKRERDKGNKLEKKVQGFEERKPRVYKDDDTWTIVSSGRNEHTVKISEIALKQLKKYYCLEKLTINQLCREMRLPRRDFYLIKTAFGITKDDVPYTDGDLINETEDDLVVDSLQEKKRLYFVKLDQEEVKHLRKEVDRYRKKDYMISRLHEITSEHMREFAQHYRGPTIQRPAITNTGLMLEVPIVDLHLGKLAWAPETGENYDYKIARKRFADVNAKIISKAAGRGIEKILFIIGNDYFNTDNQENTTTKGTPQDTDMRWQKLFAVGVDMLVQEIDKYSMIAPVEVIEVPGNHDKSVAYYAIMYLMAWYRNSEVVTVSEDIRTRKYIEYGKGLLCLTHGVDEGGRIFALPSIEQSVAWGRTRFKEVHTAHYHSEKTVEKSGVIVRRLSAMPGDDSYHFEHGFVGAIKKTQCFLWEKQEGITEIWHFNI